VVPGDQLGQPVRLAELQPGADMLTRIHRDRSAVLETITAPADSVVIFQTSSPAPLAPRAPIFAHQFHDSEIIAVDWGVAVVCWCWATTDPPRSPDPPRKWGTCGQ